MAVNVIAGREEALACAGAGVEAGGEVGGGDGVLVPEGPTFSDCSFDMVLK